jgi:hypothetical protein
VIYKYQSKLFDIGSLTTSYVNVNKSQRKRSCSQLQVNIFTINEYN